MTWFCDGNKFGGVFMDVVNFVREGTPRLVHLYLASLDSFLNSTDLHNASRWTLTNFKVRERIRNGKPDTFRDFFENFMSDKTVATNLEYSEILRQSNIFIAAGNVAIHPTASSFTSADI
jgi:hypothetical protein